MLAAEDIDPVLRREQPLLALDFLLALDVFGEVDLLLALPALWKGLLYDDDATADRFHQRRVVRALRGRRMGAP